MKYMNLGTDESIDIDNSTDLRLQLIPATSLLWVKWTVHYKPLLTYHLRNHCNGPLTVHFYGMESISHTIKQILDALEALVLYTPPAMEDVRLKQLGILAGEVGGSNNVFADVKCLVIVANVVRKGCDSAWFSPEKQGEDTGTISGEEWVRMGREMESVTRTVIHAGNEDHLERRKQEKWDMRGEENFRLSKQKNLGPIPNASAARSLPNLLTFNTNTEILRPTTAQETMASLVETGFNTDSNTSQLSNQNSSVRDFDYLPKEMRILGIGRENLPVPPEPEVTPLNPPNVKLRKASKLKKFFLRIKTLGTGGSSNTTSKRDKLRSRSMTILPTSASSTDMAGATELSSKFMDVNVSCSTFTDFAPKTIRPRSEPLVHLSASNTIGNMKPYNVSGLQSESSLCPIAKTGKENLQPIAYNPPKSPLIPHESRIPRPIRNSHPPRQHRFPSIAYRYPKPLSRSNPNIAFNQPIYKFSHTHTQFCVIPRALVGSPDPPYFSSPKDFENYFDYHPFWLLIKLLLGPSTAEKLWHYVSGIEYEGDGDAYCRVDRMENLVCFKDNDEVQSGFTGGQKIIFDGMASTKVNDTTHAPLLFKFLHSTPGETVNDRYLVAFNEPGKDVKRLLKAVKLVGDKGIFSTIHAERPGGEAALPDLTLLGIMRNVGMIAKMVTDIDMEEIKKDREDREREQKRITRMERNFEEMKIRYKQSSKSFWDMNNGLEQQDALTDSGYLKLPPSIIQMGSKPRSSTSSLQSETLRSEFTANEAHDGIGILRPEVIEAQVPVARKNDYAAPPDFDHKRFIWYHPDVKPLNLEELDGRLRTAQIAMLFRQGIEEVNSLRE